MSIDFTTNGAHQSMFGQPDIDQPFNSLQGGDLNNAYSGSHLSGHPLDRNDPLDMGEHSSYDIFSSTSSGSLPSQRYRQNGSSSTSLGVDPMYHPPSFGDSLPPFQSSNSNPYDLIGSLSSSYSSGKPSPITPNDVSGLPHASGFPFSNGQSKDFPSHPSYHEPMLDRRLSNVNGSSYSNEFNDDFNSLSVNSGLGINGFPSNLPFPDRLGRDSRFPNSTIPPLSAPSHLTQNHSPELIRGVAPQATFRPETTLPSFDDMGFMAPNPAVDYRLPASVDENMARLRLQGAGDLQTFIRYVPCHWQRSHLSHDHSSVPARIWISTFGRPTVWRSVNGRSSSCLPKWLKSHMAQRNGRWWGNLPMIGQVFTTCSAASSVPHRPR